MNPPTLRDQSTTDPKRTHAHALIAGLLSRLFNSYEFEFFFAMVTNDIHARDFPRNAESMRAQIHRAVEHFERLQCIDDVFFDRMIDARPRSSLEIDDVRCAYGLRPEAVERPSTGG